MSLTLKQFGEGKRTKASPKELEISELKTAGDEDVLAELISSQNMVLTYLGDDINELLNIKYPTFAYEYLKTTNAKGTEMTWNHPLKNISLQTMLKNGGKECWHRGKYYNIAYLPGSQSLFVYMLFSMLVRPMIDGIMNQKRFSLNHFIIEDHKGKLTPVPQLPNPSDRISLNRIFPKQINAPGTEYHTWRRTVTAS